MKRTQRTRLKVSQHPSYFLILVIVALVVVGLIAISSASSVLGFQTFDDSLYLFKKQFINVIVGFIVMWVFYKIDIYFWKKISFLLLMVAIGFLVAIFIPFFGIAHGGATRWIGFGDITLFQPSEFLKFAIIVYLASLFDRKGVKIKDFYHGTAPFLAILAIISFLIIMQPDMGTLLVTLGISGVMYFVSGAKMSHILSIVAMGCLAIVGMIKISSYRMQRFLVFLDPEKHADGFGYQISQAKLAVGSGGLWGLGFGQSRQKHQYLPEPATDSIFAIIAEEKGMIGAFAILSLFVLFGFLGLKVAKNAPDSYQRLLAVGITFWILVQAFLNICAILSLVPLTGVPLPFVSYGGSSVVFMLAACGLLLRISNNSHKEQK